MTHLKRSLHKNRASNPAVSSLLLFREDICACLAHLGKGQRGPGHRGNWLSAQLGNMLCVP